MKQPKRYSLEVIRQRLADKKNESDAIIEVLANWNLCDNPGRAILVASAINYAKKHGLMIWDEKTEAKEQS